MNTPNITTFQSAVNSHEERLPNYMAVSLEREPDSLMALSPRIMHWHDNVWLVDLQVSASYWRVQALQQDCDVMDIVRSILTHTIASDEGFYRAALADHPWQAILLFEAMEHRSLAGLLKLEAPFGASVYREISWATWWSSSLNFAKHCELTQLEKRKFNGGQFRSRCSQMQKAMKRLGIKTPWGLSEMDPMQIKRRFGKAMHDLCQWSFRKSDNFSNHVNDHVNDHILANNCFHGFALQRNLFGQECDFPWVTFTSPEQPKVSRHLDFPLTEWEQISPILCSDLDRLCNLDEFRVGERIVSLEWRIVFQDLSYLVIPIKFRHPHSLHNEMTRHCTALLQALYAFESSLRGSPLDKARLDELIPIEPIVSWAVSISERLVLPDQLVNLFADSQGATGETGEAGQAGQAGSASNTRLLSLIAKEKELLEIENRLPVILESYELRHDTLPEDSYAVFNRKESYEVETKVVPTLAAQAQNRPLFIYREPLALDDARNSVLGAFTERTLDKWWRSNEDSKKRPLQRDYYRMITKEQKALWVFRDNAKHSESFYIHGIFA